MSYEHVIDTRDHLACAYASDWMEDNLDLPAPVEVRHVRLGEEPATYRHEGGKRTAIDAPQWLLNALRLTWMGLDDFEADWAQASPQEREQLVATGVALAAKRRGEG